MDIEKEIIDISIYEVSFNYIIFKRGFFGLKLIRIEKYM